MTKQEIVELVCKKIANDLNWNEMQIRQETITDIVNECGTLQPCILAMQPAVKWFNSHKLADKPLEKQKPYVGVIINLISLLAANDIAGMMKNWVLCDME